RTTTCRRWSCSPRSLGITTGGQVAMPSWSAGRQQRSTLTACFRRPTSTSSRPPQTSLTKSCSPTASSARSAPGGSGWGSTIQTILATASSREIPLPSIEDMIADRLGQYAVASPADDSRLRQAILLFWIADELDRDYLLRRVGEEGGDPSLLPGLTEGG